LRGETPSPVAAAPRPDGSLPPLEALVGRVPAHLAGLLDDLFRAKFTGVRRFPAEPSS
jgi:hypothetical protein